MLYGIDDAARAASQFQDVRVDAIGRHGPRVEA
jgi:hypothetical protein